MKKLLSILLLTAAISSPARAMVESDYDSDKPMALTTWYEPRSAAALEADRAYVKGMIPHHAGALTMSQQYLADPDAGSPTLKALARGIIRNQTFEIGVLNRIEREIDSPPNRFRFGPFNGSAQPVAQGDMIQNQRFMRSPIPGRFGIDPATVTKRDVQFAKAMMIHHQAAVDMAREYHANPAVKNNYLDLLNVDIILDQTQEIALMQDIVDAYRGDASAIRVDPSMVHGMGGMKHGGQSHAAMRASGHCH